MADENTSPTGASEPNPADAGASGAGSGDDGAQGGASSTAESFAAERSALEAEARKWQGLADKAEAERAALAARLDAQTKSDPADKSDPEPLTAEQVRREAMSASLLAASLANAQADLKSEFPEADASIFQRLVDFESVEALRASVEASHAKNKAAADALREKVQAEVLKDVAEKYGIEIGPPEPAGETPTGDPTLAQLNAMSQPELDALEAAKPGVIARVSGVQGSPGGGWNG